MAEEEYKPQTKPVPYKQLKTKISELEQRLEYPYWDGFDKEWRPVSRAYEQPPKMPLSLYSSAVKPENRDRNRYGNALPPEQTRVKLTTGDNDYINANWIKNFDGKATYIITQGPMPETFGDFWRMVWENNCSVIVMLTKEVEDGRPKCERYWPEKEKPFETAAFVVTFVSEDVKDSGELFVRTFTLKKKDSSDAERTITQYQYTAWPDQGIPPSFHSFLEIVKGSDDKKGEGPITVHCSAGLGRSGAFAMVHDSFKQLVDKVNNKKESDPEFHMEDLIVRMRKERHGLIQTGKQFEFVYRAIAELSEEFFKQKEEQTSQN